MQYVRILQHCLVYSDTELILTGGLWGGEVEIYNIISGGLLSLQQLVNPILFSVFLCRNSVAGNVTVLPTLDPARPGQGTKIVFSLSYLSVCIAGRGFVYIC
jgi:hypothetical protein